MPEVLLRNGAFLFGGFGITLGLALVVAVLGTVLAIPLALLRWARVPLLSPLCSAFTGLIRGSPVLVVLLVAAFALPATIGVRIDPLVASAAGFTVFLAAYAAEDLRAGLQSVSVAAVEAGTALGLTPVQVTRLVVLPLGLRIAAPALVGQYVRMVKYTSVASVLGVTELTGRGLLVNARVFQPVPLLLFMAACYLVVCLGLSLAGRWLQRRWSDELRRGR